MEKERILWLVMKGLSFAAVGAILYTVFSLRGL